MNCKKIWTQVSLITIFVLIFGIFTYASEPQTMSVEEAKTYLLTYKEVCINEFGKEYTIEFNFKSDEDLNRAAIFISKNGVDVFHQECNNEIKKIVANEKKSPITRTTTPQTVRKTVSGDGRHTVNAEASGLASFEQIGTLEYIVELGYTVDVSNGKFTGLTNIHFDIPYIGNSGSFGDITLPSHCTNTNAGVTANYTISKTVTVSVGDFGVDVITKTDNEIFSLLTSIS